MTWRPGQILNNLKKELSPDLSKESYMLEHFPPQELCRTLRNEGLITVYHITHSHDENVKRGYMGGDRGGGEYGTYFTLYPPNIFWFAMPQYWSPHQPEPPTIYKTKVPIDELILDWELWECIPKYVLDEAYRNVRTHEQRLALDKISNLHRCGVGGRREGGVPLRDIAPICEILGPQILFEHSWLILKSPRKIHFDEIEIVHLDLSYEEMDKPYREILKRMQRLIDEIDVYPHRESYLKNQYETYSTQLINWKPVFDQVGLDTVEYERLLSDLKRIIDEDDYNKFK